MTTTPTSVILGLVPRIHSSRRAIIEAIRCRRLRLPTFVRADLRMDPRDKPEGDGCAVLAVGVAA